MGNVCGSDLTETSMSKLTNMPKDLGLQLQLSYFRPLVKTDDKIEVNGALIRRYAKAELKIWMLRMKEIKSDYWQGK